MEQTPVPRHVLFLNWRDTRNPEGGGSEVYVERIAAELVAIGHRATLLCAAHQQGPANETTPDGVDVVRRGGRHTVYARAALTYIAGFFGFGRLARRALGRPDLIVDVGNGLPFLAPFYARRPVIALVHHVHREQWPVVLPGWRCRVGWWVESWLAPRVYRRCRYVTVSEASRSELAELGVDPERVTVIHNGTPEPSAEPIARSAQPSLLVLGRLVPHKQVEVALRAVAQLAPEFPDLELVVSGQGWWAPRLVALAESLSIMDRVRFAGYVGEAEKHQLLGWAWVALTTSVKEGWGLTIVEAGARGTPTVAFRTAGGVAEALVDGQTGMLADDEADFVAHVRQLLRDPQRREQLGAAARTHARSFTWGLSAQRFTALVVQETAALDTGRPREVAPREVVPPRSAAPATRQF